MARFNKSPTLSQRSNVKGQAILEYLGYIALAALALAALGYFVYKARGNTVVNNESATLNDMVMGTQKLYSSDPSAYANVSLADLIANGIVDNRRVVGNALSSGFGTPITIAPATLYTANDGVSFTYGVPSDQCSAFVQSVAPSFAKVSVGGAVIKDATAGTALSPASLGSKCNSGSGANVTMVLTATR